MELLANIPLPLLIFLVFIALLILIASLVFFLTRSKKPKTADKENPLVTDQPTTISQDQPLLDLSQPQPPISTELAKPNEGRFIFLIVVGAVVAILIPIIAVFVVKNQTLESQTPTTEETATKPACTVITITDTLGNLLNQDQLKKLRPGDEVKIIISANSPNLEKARFRVNGSQWQEVIIKEDNNFIGNYILITGTKKFTIEAEVYDKNKGWL